MPLSKQITAFMALVGLITAIYGAIVWHDKYALAMDVSIVEIRQDLTDAKRHYYTVYEYTTRNPNDSKLQRDLKEAEEEVSRLTRLLNDLKAKKAGK